MATIDLGKIAFVDKGTWSSSTAYTEKDVVQYDDAGTLSTYIAVASSTNQAPSTGGTINGSYWSFMAKGAGSGGGGGGGGGEWTVVTEIDDISNTSNYTTGGNYPLELRLPMDSSTYNSWKLVMDDFGYVSSGINHTTSWGKVELLNSSSNNRDTGSTWYTRGIGGAYNNGSGSTFYPFGGGNSVLRDFTKHLWFEMICRYTNNYGGPSNFWSAKIEHHGWSGNTSASQVYVTGYNAWSQGTQTNIFGVDTLVLAPQVQGYTSSQVPWNYGRLKWYGRTE